MSEPMWGRRCRPDPGPAASSVGSWEPISPSDLTVDRRELATALRHAGPVGADADTVQDALERLLLAYEELASNALRHGRAPIQVAVTAFGTSWLLDVSDAADDQPPMPAVDRDPAEGGLGLHLVARICTAHGWCTRQGRKSVWACIDVLDGAEPSAQPAGGSSATR